MNLFDEVRHRLDDMVQVAEVNGFEVKRGFISCPFHGSDTTPSLKLYRNSWYCYGCGEGGDAVAFISKLYGLKPIDAVKWLDSTFHLHLPLHAPQTAAQHQRIEREERRRRHIRESREAFTAWRNEALDMLNRAFRVGHTALLMLETEADVDRLTAEEILAVRSMAFLEYAADTLTHGDMTEMMAIFRQRGEVTRLCQAIISPTQTSRLTPTKSLTA